MRGRTGVALGLLAATIFRVPAFAGEAKLPLVLAPSSPWNVVYDDDTCRMRRVFGTGQQIVALDFEQAAPGQPYGLVLSGTGAKILRDRETITVTFGDAIVLSDLTWIAAIDPRGTKFMELRLSVRIDRNDDDKLGDKPYLRQNALNGADYVGLRSGKNLFRLDTGPMNVAKSALDQCVDQLLTTWGLDPAIQRALLRGPEPSNNVANWLTTNDYPEGAGSGIIRFRLEVGASGIVTGCHVQSGLSVKDFAEVTCRNITRRARFHPALDAAGKPVASFYANMTRWEMGED